MYITGDTCAPKTLKQSPFLEDFKEQFDKEISRLYNGLNDIENKLLRIHNYVEPQEPMQHNGSERSEIDESTYFQKLRSLLGALSVQNNRLEKYNRHLSEIV